MTKLLWIVVQAAIVGLFLWIEYVDSAWRKKPPDVGLALFYGMMMAFSGACRKVFLRSVCERTALCRTCLASTRGRVLIA